MQQLYVNCTTDVVYATGDRLFIITSMFETPDPKSVDPRIRRTRLLLQDALTRLLKRRSFDEISIQDLTEEATLNRATFYAHYPDKYVLLECTTAARFQELLDERGVSFDGSCVSVWRIFLLGICDYLATTLKTQCEQQRAMDPYMESAITSVVQRMILDGLERHSWEGTVSRQLVAATASWALYGAAREWVRTLNGGSSEMIVDGVTRMLVGLFGAVYTGSASPASQTAW